MGDNIYWGQYDRDEGIRQAYDMMKYLRKDDSYLRQTLRQMERENNTERRDWEDD